MKKALFLDRDGVLNQLISNRPPWQISEIKIFNESFEIIDLAKSRLYLPIVITNQPDAGRGTITYENLDLINSFIMKKLDIKNFYICKHPYDGMCDCRKPLAGSFFNASDKHDIDLQKSFMIGDREKDIIAGNKAGCKTIKISKMNSEISDYNVSNHIELITLLRKLLK